MEIPRKNYGKIFIGTSGWHYAHWKGTFYPDTIRAKDQFSTYTNHFQTVEINNSFYRLPSADTFTSWKNAAPDDFVFAVKASRFITHLKKLAVDKEPVSEFLQAANHLGEKLGPVLFQLPPRWSYNLPRLKQFISLLPVDQRYTIEFRDQSWYNTDLYKLLLRNNIAFCIYHLDRHLSPIEVTADFVYIRLHGPKGKYQGSYSLSELKEWKDKILNWSGEGLDVYVYFDNDEKGYAAFNAGKLKELNFSG